MKTKAYKTNASRLLDKTGIPYKLISYEVDEADLSAVHVAEQLGENVRRIFKTLVLFGDKNGYFVCLISGDLNIDLKAAAKVSGNKKAEMISVKELLPLTGYVRGGCSPIGMKKKLPTFIHKACMNFDTIYVSAGARGLQLEVEPERLVRYLDAEVVDIATVVE